MSFTSGVFPSTRKFTSILLGHQKDSKLDYSSYLPISLLSSLGKILEKLMSIAIFKFFNNNNFFYPLQFGFRQNYSTRHALVSLTETIWEYVDEGKLACGIFLDLEKVFCMAQQMFY